MLLCGDFNIPGRTSTEIDEDLAALFNVHNLLQHVGTPTRRHTATGRKNTLDMLIASRQSKIVSKIEVTNSHKLLDHSMVTCQLDMKKVKLPSVPFVYRQIKKINVAAFELKLLSSKLSTSTTTSSDAYLDEIEEVVTDLLDSVAPLRSRKRPGPSAAGCRPRHRAQRKTDCDSRGGGKN